MKQLLWSDGGRILWINEQTIGISREKPNSERLDNDLKYRVLGSFYCKPIESETLGLEPKNSHFKKIHVCFICTLSLNRSPLGRNLSRKPFHQGRLCCPSRDYFVGIWLLIQLGWTQGTYLKSFKSCKVRSLMSAADQRLDLIYFGSYQEKERHKTNGKASGDFFQVTDLKWCSSF